MEKGPNIINDLNKLSMPATILIGCVILGAFYYFSQVSKQNSIEKQQQLELQTKKEARTASEARESHEKLSRIICAGKAEKSATEQYKKTCSYDCKEGYYYTANYDNYFKICLQGYGLDN